MSFPRLSPGKGWGAILATALAAAGLIGCDTDPCADRPDDPRPGTDGGLSWPETGPRDQGTPDWDAGDVGTVDASPVGGALLLNPKSGPQDKVGLGARALCFDGEQFFVAWAERPFFPSGGEPLVTEVLRVRVVSATGAALYPAQEVARLSEGVAQEMSIHCTGDGHAVLWFRHNIDGQGPLQNLRVDASGALSGKLNTLDNLEIRKPSATWGSSVAFSAGMFGGLVCQWNSTLRKYQLSFFIAPKSATIATEPLPLENPDQKHQYYPTVVSLSPADDEGHTFFAYWTEDNQLQKVGVTVELPRNGPTWEAKFGSTSQVFQDGNQQQQPGARIWGDDAGAALYSWEGEDVWNPPFFAYHDLGQEPWGSPADLVGFDNRYESLDYAAGLNKDQAVVVWQGNHQTALPQIYSRRLDLSRGSAELTEWVSQEPPLVVSDASPYRFEAPVVTAGPNEHWAVVFSGAINGAEELFFRLLE